MLSIDDLYREHSAAVARVCRRYLGNTPDADDAVQETFARVAGRVHRLRPDARAYLLTVARNVCFDEQRRRVRLDTGAQDLEREATGGRPEELAEDRARLSVLRSGLPDRDRQLLAYWHWGFSSQEIATMVGATRGAVAVGITRARQRARRLLSDAEVACFAPLARLFGSSGRLRGAHAHAGAVNHGAALLSVLMVGSVASNVVPAAIPTAVPALRQVVTALATPAPANHSFGAQPAGSATTITPAAGTSAAIPRGSGPVNITSETASPYYTSDQTVFATGDECALSCPVLLRTMNGGTSWKRLAARGYLGGEILLPPRFGADRDIFAAGPGGLQLSRDSGESFETVASVRGPAAVLPDSVPEHDRVLIGSDPLVIYDERTGEVSRVALLPAGLKTLDDLAFVSDATHVVVAARQDAGAHPFQSVVLRCNLYGRCSEVLNAKSSGQLHLATVSGKSVNDLVYVYSERGIWYSSDGGGSFGVGVDAGGTILSATVAPGASGAGVLTIDRLPGPDGTQHGSPANAQIIRSWDGGRSFSPITSPAERWVFNALLELTDGKLLGALAQGPIGEVRGMRCSSDSGRTWTATC